jgi:hypothetical protein
VSNPEIRLVLPPGVKHMFLVDDDDEPVVEIHDYALRRAIESGEVNPCTNEIIEGHRQDYLRGLRDGSIKPVLKCQCGQKPCKGHEYANGVILIPGIKNQKELDAVDNYIVFFDYPGQSHQEIIRKHGRIAVSNP